MKMSPLHEIVHVLLEKIPFENYSCDIDNLYLS